MQKLRSLAQRRTAASMFMFVLLVTGALSLYAALTCTPTPPIYTAVKNNGATNFSLTAAELVKPTIKKEQISDNPHWIWTIDSETWTGTGTKPAITPSGFEGDGDYRTMAFTVTQAAAATPGKYTVKISAEGYYRMRPEGSTSEDDWKPCPVGNGRIPKEQITVVIYIVKVDFSNLVAVYKGSSADVTVTVTPSLPTGKTVTLKLTTTTGTGSATFSDGSAQKAIPSTTTSVTVNGGAVSSVEENIKLSAEIDGEECGFDNFSVIELKLQEVGFSGTGEHVMKKTGAGNYNYLTMTFGEDGDTTITDPIWKDDNLDGDVSDPADKYDPICFTKSSTPTITAKIIVKPTLSGSVPGQIRIVGATTPETVWLEKNVAITGTALNLNDALQIPFGTNVDCLEWALQWQVVMNSRPKIKFADSKHLTFITYGTPSGSSVTAKRVHWSTWRCIYKSNLNPDDIPRAMQAGVQAEGAGHFQGGAGLANPWSLFDPGVKGPCVTYSAVMELGLQMLGVPAAKTTNTSVTSHEVATTQWLGQAVAYSVLRWFCEWGSAPWVNEGVCGVNTDGSGWLYYDVAGGSTYGPKAGPTVGAQYAAQPTALVENQWREPVPSHGPIMKDWYFLPLYSNGIDYPLPNQVKVKSPNGGENIVIGTQVNVSLYTAGLQGYVIEVYYRNVATGTDTAIGSVTVAAAATEAGNFSKESIIVWNTTGLPAGQYFIGIKVQGMTGSDARYYDWSDAAFQLQ